MDQDNGVKADTNVLLAESQARDVFTDSVEETLPSAVVEYNYAPSDCDRKVIFMDEVSGHFGEEFCVSRDNRFSHTVASDNTVIKQEPDDDLSGELLNKPENSSTHTTLSHFKDDEHLEIKDEAGIHQDVKNEEELYVLDYGLDIKEEECVDIKDKLILNVKSEELAGREDTNVHDLCEFSSNCDVKSELVQAKLSTPVQKHNFPAPVMLVRNTCDLKNLSQRSISTATSPDNSKQDDSQQISGISAGALGGREQILFPHILLLKNAFNQISKTNEIVDSISSQESIFSTGLDTVQETGCSSENVDLSLDRKERHSISYFAAHRHVMFHIEVAIKTNHPFHRSPQGYGMCGIINADGCDEKDPSLALHIEEFRCPIRFTGCTYTTADCDALEQHINSHNGVKTIRTRCKFCFFTGKLREVVQHITIEHADWPPYRFESKDPVSISDVQMLYKVDHSDTEHSEASCKSGAQVVTIKHRRQQKSCKCPLCLYESMSAKDLEWHLVSSHSVAYIFVTCRNCSFSSYSVATMLLHVQSSHTVLYKTDLNNSYSFWYSSLPNKKSQSRPSHVFHLTGFHCPFSALGCQFSISSLPILADHTLYTHRIKSFSIHCKICKFNTTQPVEILSHMREVHFIEVMTDSGVKEMLRTQVDQKKTHVFDSNDLIEFHSTYPCNDKIVKLKSLVSAGQLKVNLSSERESSQTDQTEKDRWIGVRSSTHFNSLIGLVAGIKRSTNIDSSDVIKEYDRTPLLLCHIIDCPNWVGKGVPAHPGKHVFPFPKEHFTRKRKLHHLRTDLSKETKIIFICDKHFEPEDLIYGEENEPVYLCKGAEPIFLPPSEIKSTGNKDLQETQVVKVRQKEPFLPLPKTLNQTKSAKILLVNAQEGNLSKGGLYVRVIVKAMEFGIVYQCNHCPYIHEKYQAVIKHTKKKHPEYLSFLCDGKVSPSVNLTHNIIMYCVMCNYVGCEAILVQRHLAELHSFAIASNSDPHTITSNKISRNVLKCPSCPYLALSVGHLNSHQHYHHSGHDGSAAATAEKKPNLEVHHFVCTTCQYITFLPREMINHMCHYHQCDEERGFVTCMGNILIEGKDEDGSTSWRHISTNICRLCVHVTESEDEMETHFAQSHSLKMIYSCQHCTFLTLTVSELVMHTAVRHRRTLQCCNVTLTFQVNSNNSSERKQQQQQQQQHQQQLRDDAKRFAAEAKAYQMMTHVANDVFVETTDHEEVYPTDSESSAKVSTAGDGEDCKNTSVTESVTIECSKSTIFYPDTQSSELTQNCPDDGSISVVTSGTTSTAAIENGDTNASMTEPSDTTDSCGANEDKIANSTSSINLVRDMITLKSSLIGVPCHSGKSIILPLNSSGTVMCSTVNHSSCFNPIGVTSSRSEGIQSTERKLPAKMRTLLPKPFTGRDECTLMAKSSASMISQLLATDTCETSVLKSSSQIEVPASSIQGATSGDQFHVNHLMPGVNLNTKNSGVSLEIQPIRSNSGWYGTGEKCIIKKRPRKRKNKNKETVTETNKYRKLYRGIAQCTEEVISDSKLFMKPVVLIEKPKL